MEIFLTSIIYLFFVLVDKKTPPHILQMWKKFVIEEIDKGRIRVAEPGENGWVVNEWVKKAVILYFPIRKMETIEVY